MVKQIKNLTLSDEQRLELRIYQILRLSCVPIERRGGRILFAAIKLCVLDIVYLDSMTKLLYPKLAELFETTPSCVEKNIREAVACAWNGGMGRFFEKNLHPISKKPGNSAFIKQIVFLIKIFTENEQNIVEL